MRKSRKGLIFTNDKCIGCNRCIMSCPIPGANKSVSRNGKNIIMVDPEKCIHCGNCLRECRHGAREFLDDTKEFLNDLGNEKISLLLAPSFFLLYPDICGRVINFFLENGISSVFDASFGADIAIWAYLKHYDESQESGAILQTCPSLVNFIEKYSPKLLEKLMPVQSPAVCSAIYLHKYLKIQDKLAFIGPCIAKKDEFDSSETNGEIAYNVTFSHLMDALSAVDLNKYSNEFEGRNTMLGSTVAVFGGMKNNLSNFIDDSKYVLSVDHAVYYFPVCEYYENNVFNDKNIPFASEIVTCEHGCIAGSGAEPFCRNRAEIAQDCLKLNIEAVEKHSELYSKLLSAEAKKEKLYRRFQSLNPDDFRREHTGRFVKKYNVPDSVIDEIFTYMYKPSKEDRCIDCGSCGYGTCREMAEAIALGYNRKENCVYYEKEENRRLYLTDIMTGIPNISYFNSKLTEIIRKNLGGEYAVVSFTLVGWELLNERFTYAEGDKAIIEFAKKAESLADPSELVAHHGGVDFLAVIKKKKLNVFLNAIQDIKVHPNDGLKEVEYPVTITAGIYMMRDYEKAAETVVGRTNIAALNARVGGAKIAYYDQSMKEQLIDSIQLIKSFPEAVKKEEFLVYYQPKVNIETSAMRGAEALVRWKSKKELISPARFIPLFEKNGIICDLDFYMLRHVCADIRKWLDEGLSPVCISVNFSKLHFRDKGLAEAIEQTVDEYGVPHNLIEIEVTESAYEKTKESLRAVLKALKEKGFSTSIDDFGSGYSSLNLLSQMDFQVLKLDKAFLDSGIEEKKVKHVIDSVITMAKKLDMKVVAEGVEHKEELELLRELSCDLIQGYYFDRPIPVKEFETRLRMPDYYTV